MRRAWPIAAVLLAGCASYSPPVRSLGYGAPGRLRAGDVEVGGGFVGVGAPVVGSGWLAYAPRDWASIEIGADGSREGWGMAFVGGRFTHAPRRDRKYHLALDGELGAGIGAGGHCQVSLQTETCTRKWFDRAAFGAYAGGGVGYHLSFFSLYARGRVQPTVSDGLPRTLWGATQGGFQFRIAKVVDLFAAAGVGGFVTGGDRTTGFVYDVGIAVHFGTRRR